jgi:hypothetical protein
MSKDRISPAPRRITTSSLARTGEDHQKGNWNRNSEIRNSWFLVTYTRNQVIKNSEWVSTFASSQFVIPLRLCGFLSLNFCRWQSRSRRPVIIIVFCLFDKSAQEAWQTRSLAANIQYDLVAFVWSSVVKNDFLFCFQNHISSVFSIFGRRYFVNALRPKQNFPDVDSPSCFGE